MPTPLTARMGYVQLTFALAAGQPTYAVAYGPKPVVNASRLDIAFQGGQGPTTG